ncbi:MAG: LacI family DNA-binding transcriptional regulator [Bacteroidota bacterium]|nr:LacI family DNA-binding transcriptional regulator [Bacteroidota bacterium]
MRRRKHVTLEDIAEKLKVSRVTVSKALRGHSDISDETKKEVRRIAKILGYSPNYMARNLSSRRSNMLGVVVPKLAHFFFGSMLEAVYNTAFENNYETILTVSQENAERERKHLETLISMRVDGIIISISQETKDTGIFQWVKKMGVPLVFVDRRPEPALPGFSTVLIDDEAGTRNAVEHAIKIGYREMGFIGGGNPWNNIGKNRLLGFMNALKSHGIAIQKEWVVSGGFGTKDGFEGFMRLHTNGTMPEFVFAATYPVALGIYQAVKELGMKIPDDIDIMCFGDSDLSHLLTPSLSCVNQPTLEIGTAAVQTILDLIRNPDKEKEHHLVIPTTLLLRDTCSTVARARREERKTIVTPMGPSA